jgi:hypothetical protein
MKKLLLLTRTTIQCMALTLLGSLFAVPTIFAGEDSIQDCYEKGRTAYFSKRFDVAKPYLQKVAKAAPGHGPTRAMLGTILAAEKKAKSGKNTMLAWATKLKLPKIELEDATIEEVVQFVRIKSRELSKGAWEPNFIVRLPEGEEAPRISLSLRNVPVNYIVKAMAEASGLAVRYDKHAILLAPADQLPPEPDPAELAAEQAKRRPLLGEKKKDEEE